jgi:6,7-dimethyl-8-ribityllumazine synthase
LARELRGNLQGNGLRVAIVVARFNQFVTQKLLEGALDALSRHGVVDDDVTVAWVPGSFELPLAAKTLARTGAYDAVVCLGAVIRGETTHYDMVAGQAASGISRAALDTEVPVIFGVLTCENMDQAIDRAGGKSGNLGHNAAVSAIEMARLLLAIKGPRTTVDQGAAG